MPTHLFLSDDWITEARRIQAEVASENGTRIAPVRMNLVVGDMPFGPPSLDAHIDTTGGDVEIDLDHLQNPDVTVKLSYDLAKAILVNGDGQAAVGAFFTRKLRIDGDMGKLLAFQAAPTSARQIAITEAIREMTT